MSSKELAKLIKSGAAEWNAWRSVHNSDSIYFPPGTDLSNITIAAGTNLTHVSFNGVNLAGSDLRGVDASRADFSNAILERALLDGARMVKANLRNAILSGASLRSCDLASASFRGATLNMSRKSKYDHTYSPEMSEAIRCYETQGKEVEVLRTDSQGEVAYYVHDAQVTDLTGAKVEGTDLRNALVIDALIEGISFSNVQLGGTVIDCDLSNVLNLDAAVHSSKSFLSSRAIKTLPNPLPIDFLQGCGLSDWEIRFCEIYNPQLTNYQLTDVLYQIYTIRADAPIQYYSVFISYSHEDKVFAERLYGVLQSRGIRCWYDQRSMAVGENIHEAIDHGIKISDRILLCCSKHSLSSWWVDGELERVFDKERSMMQVSGVNVSMLYPLNLDGFLLDGEKWSSGKASLVRSRLAADFVGWEKDEAKLSAGIERVISALRADGVRCNETPVTVWKAVSRK